MITLTIEPREHTAAKEMRHQICAILLATNAAGNCQMHEHCDALLRLSILICTTVNTVYRGCILLYCTVRQALPWTPEKSGRGLLRQVNRTALCARRCICTTVRTRYVRALGAYLNSSSHSDPSSITLTLVGSPSLPPFLHEITIRISASVPLRVLSTASFESVSLPTPVDDPGTGPSVDVVHGMMWSRMWWYD
jgi:hypothetical protein